VRRRGALAALLTIPTLLASAAAAKDRWIGTYRVAEGPDVAGGIELRADHRFAYVLAAGALDEQARGSWRVDGAVVRLTTQPKPRPATFAPAPVRDPPGGRLKLSVTWPDGRGIAGIDFRIGFASGDPVEGYTQEDGWEAEPGETRQPQWIELAEPIHDVASPRFAVAAGQHALVFVLTPNDLGTVDFVDAVLAAADGRFVLRHPRGPLRLTKER
jgi:hypothetical protein